MSLGGSWANIWTQGKRYDLDYEILHSRLSLSYGVNHRFLFTAAFEKKNYFGGAMDGFLIAFHNLIGVEQDGRDKVKSNKAHYLFRDAQGHVIVDSTDIAVFNNNALQASVSYILTPGSRWLPAVNLSGTVSWSLNTPLMGSGEAVDTAFGVGLSKRWAKKWLTYHEVSFIYFGKNELPHFSMKNNGYSLINAVVWEWRPSISWLLQFMYTNGLIKDFPDLKDPSYEAHIGMKWQTKHDGMFEFAVIENVINYDNSPDFGVHLKYTLALK